MFKIYKFHADIFVLYQERVTFCVFNTTFIIQPDIKCFVKKLNSSPHALTLAYKKRSVRLFMSS